MADNLVLLGAILVCLVVVYVSNRFSPVRRSVTRLIPLLLVLLVIAGIVGMVLAA